MANHKSSIKRIRQTKTKTLHNKYYAKTMRNAVRKLRAMTNKEEAMAMRNIIHKNKAANIKSGLALYINSLD